MNKQYPQNYIIKKPYTGTLIFLAFCLGFVLLYKPLNVHEARFFSFEITMAIYLGALSIPVFIVIKILKSIRYFSNPDEWTIFKEIFSIAIILLGMGIVGYFMGFLMESPAKRWNLDTFLDSCLHTFLIGIIPFFIFTALNYRHLFATELVRNFIPDIISSSPEEPEKLIRIGSQLKKEELTIYPSQFVYAVSDGNYIVFYLNVNNQIQKKIIRNSISIIAEQLSAIPYFMRTHRGFIVNVKQVISQKGNTLGYRLKLEGIDDIIPVSRQNAREFDQLLKRYH
jgi:FlaA1/EpsC-like NDP-sugar epimerase